MTQAFDQMTAAQQEWMQRKKAEAEADAKRRTFNWGSLLPALAAAPFTGGGSLAGTIGSFAANALPAAIGEGVRASTGSDTDYGSLMSTAANLYKGPKPMDTATTSTAPTLPDTSKAIGPRLQNGNFLSPEAHKMIANTPAPTVSAPSFIGDIGSAFQDALRYRPPTADETYKAKMLKDAIAGGARLESVTDPRSGAVYKQPSILEEELNRAKLNESKNRETPAQRLAREKEVKMTPPGKAPVTTKINYSQRINKVLQDPKLDIRIIDWIDANRGHSSDEEIFNELLKRGIVK